MILSQLCQAVRQRRSPQGDVQKPGEQVLKLEPPVEPVAEFGQIPGKVLFPNGMIRPVKGVLDVARQGVDPKKLGVLDAGRSSARDDRAMGISRPGQFPEGGKTIGNDRAGGGQVLLGPGGNGGPGEALDPGQTEPEGMSFVRALDRRQKGGFSGRPPAAFAAMTFPAKVRVIDLDGAVQRAAVVSLLLSLSDLVLQKPGGVVIDPQLAGKLHGADGVLALGQEVDPQKPDGQRQLGSGQDRPAGERGLAMTGVALVSAVKKNTELRTFADRALEPFRPAPLKERLAALLFGAVLPVKFRETEPFLELDPVFGHDSSNA